MILRSRLLITVLGVAFALQLGASKASAVVLASNLSASSDGYLEVGATSVTNTHLAQKFTVGSSAILGQATLQMGSGGSALLFHVDIFSDAAGKPGTSLATLTGPLSPTAGVNTYTGSVPLNAGTNYWVVASTYPFLNQLENWSVTTTTTETAQSGWSLADTYAYSINGGSTWDEGGASMQVSLEGSLVAAPEPSRFILTLAALGCLALRRRRNV
jgi:hypothetical protein